MGYGTREKGFRSSFMIFCRKVCHHIYSYGNRGVGPFEEDIKRDVQEAKFPKVVQFRGIIAKKIKFFRILFAR